MNNNERRILTIKLRQIPEEQLRIIAFSYDVFSDVSFVSEKSFIIAKMIGIASKNNEAINILKNI